MSTPSTVHSDVYSTGKAEKITIEKTIDEIRKGNGYFVSSIITTSSAIPVYTLIKSRDETIKYHVTFKLVNNDITNGVSVYLIEGTGSVITGAHAGTILIPYNLNRYSPTGSLLIQRGIGTGAGAVGTGAAIYTGFCPAYGVLKFGSSEARQNEVIIDSSKSYFFAYSGSASTVGFEIYWYEE